MTPEPDGDDRPLSPLEAATYLTGRSGRDWTAVDVMNLAASGRLAAVPLDGVLGFRRTDLDALPADPRRRHGRSGGAM